MDRSFAVPFQSPSVVHVSVVTMMICASRVLSCIAAQDDQKYCQQLLEAAAIVSICCCDSAASFPV